MSAYLPYKIEATFTAGSAVVTALPAALLANVYPGDWVRGPDERSYGVIAVASNTALTLDRPYLGDTATAEVAFFTHSPAWQSGAEINKKHSQLLDALQRGYATTSSSMIEIDMGEQLFIVAPGIPVLPGMTYKITSRANPANSMSGPIKTYVGAEMLIDVEVTEGAGTFNDWNFNIAGAVGPAGPATLFEIGNVTEVAHGQPASVDDVGTSGHVILDFEIPAGPQGVPGGDGDDGAAATVAIGIVTTGLPGSDADVDNAGTSNAAVLNFVIPRGDPGEDGNDGAAATIEIGTVSTGAPGTDVEIENVGTDAAAVLNITIPRGEAGADGLGSGDVIGDTTAAVDEIAVFNNVNGKRIKTGSKTIAQVVADAVAAVRDGVAGTYDTLMKIGAVLDPVKTKADFLSVTNAVDLDELAGDVQSVITGKGAANGYAELDGDGKLLVSQLPAIAIVGVNTVANEAAMLALTAEEGDVAIRTDVARTFILAAAPASTLANWKELPIPTDTVLAVAGLTGTITGSALKAALAITLADVTDMSTDARSLLQMAYSAMRTALGLATIATSASASDLASGTVPSARLSTNERTAGLSWSIDGGGATIATGNKRGIRVPFAGEIKSWSIGLDQSGSIVIDVWKDTHANYPPLVGATIAASAKPTVSGAQAANSATLTGWNTSVAAGDWLFFNVESVSNAQFATIVLEIEKS